MAEADRELIIRIGADVDPSVRASAEKLVAQMREASKPPAPDPAADAAWQRVLDKAEKIRQAKAGISGTGGAAPTPQAGPISPEAAQAEHADLFGAATRVARLSSAVGIGAGIANYFFKQSVEADRFEKKIESLGARGSGSLESMQQAAAALGAEMSRLREKWEVTGIRDLVPKGAEYIASVFGVGNLASDIEKVGTVAQMQADVLERALKAKHDLLDLDIGIAESNNLQLKIQREQVPILERIKDLKARQNDPTINEAEKKAAVDEIGYQTRLLNLAEARVKTQHELEEAQKREQEFLKKHAEIAAEVDRAFAEDPSGDFGRSKSRAAREEQRQHEEAQRKAAADQEQRDRVERANTLTALEKLADDTLRTSRETAELEGEQLEIARLRAYWEEKITLARKQGGREGERVARGLEEARDAQIEGVGAGRRRGEVQAAESDARAGAIGRARDLESGKTPHYEDAGGVRRERRPLMDIDDGLAPGEFGPPAPLGKRPSRSAFDDYVPLAEREKQREKARRDDEDQADRAREEAKRSGRSTSEELEDIRRREGRTSSKPIDPEIARAGKAAEEGGSGGGPGSWTRDDVTKHLEYLKDIKEKLGFGA